MASTQFITKAQDAYEIAKDDLERARRRRAQAERSGRLDRMWTARNAVFRSYELVSRIEHALELALAGVDDQNCIEISGCDLSGPDMWAGGGNDVGQP